MYPSYNVPCGTFRIWTVGRARGKLESWQEQRKGQAMNIEKLKEALTELVEEILSDIDSDLRDKVESLATDVSDMDSRLDDFESSLEDKVDDSSLETAVKEIVGDMTFEVSAY